MGSETPHDWNILPISINLVDAAVHQLDFLRKVDKHPELYSGAAVTNAIRRYETIWLPLAAKHPKESLVPPLDVHWVWHCHMLAPYYYEKDCTNITGKVVDHRLLDENGYHRGMKMCELLWHEFAKNEPFHANFEDISENNFKSKCSYNLEGAISRQRMFCYQVSLPHYRDPLFLQQSLTRYKKYLYLKKMNQDQFLVPCYDFDLIWHSHQLHPIIYKQDTERILGRMFNHDDSVNDRSENSKLSLSDANTRALWKKVFKEDFAMCGCMYRGDPPAGKLAKVTAAQLYQVSSKRANVTIHKIKVDNLNEEHTQKLTLKVSVLGPDLSISETVLKLKGPQIEWGPKELCSIAVDTAASSFLQFELLGKKGFLCLGSNHSCGMLHFRLAEALDDTPAEGQVINLEAPLLEGGTGSVSGLNIAFGLTFGPPGRGPCILALQSCPFQTYTMPENIEDLWGPIPLPKLPEGTTNTCVVASHK